MFSKFKQLNRWTWTAIILVLLSFYMLNLREPVSRAQQQEQPKKEETSEFPDFRNVSNPKPGAIARNPIDGAEMVYIPEGEFMMGTELPKGKGGYGNLADEGFKQKFPGEVIFEGYFEGYDDGYVYTAPVGSFKPNEFGLYDMAGNV